MDDFSKHIAPYPRQFTALPTIHSTGYCQNKTNWVNHSFQTVNFSFILSGNGEYKYQNETWTVAAPCVLTQWPGIEFHYGADSAWEEFYVCFPSKYYNFFLKNGLMNTEQRIWPISDIGHFMSSLRNFWDVLKENESFGWADRLDLAIQSVIFESLLGTKSSLDKNEKAINDIRLNVEMNYLADFDFDELALDAGLSPSSFRRHWQKIIEMPPMRYIMYLRICRAQRYLIETNLSIAEIAAKVQFEDQLYFTRKFKQFTDMCPTNYRHQNQMPQNS